MKRFILLLSLISSLFPSSAQTIHDQYATKAEACADASYRDCDEYYTYGQIGWEKRVGWRPILYLEQYEKDHRAYNVNMTMYVQVKRGETLVTDCEIVAVNAAGKVVGNQCPEPFPDGYGRRHQCTDVATMAVFGDLGDKIRFKVVTGSTEATLREAWADELCTFSFNTVVGLVDTNGDGRADTLQPYVLHLPLPGDVNGDGRYSIADVAGIISVLGGVDTPGINPAAADFDESGTVDISDVEALANYLLEIDKQ